ncbi:TIGR03752 family integrating conjugative element protein, partial [Klebsiella pneumoniae]|nr:TIGR03752 family integrating conjugative element protein [Klebsiella pneumoniae]
QVNLTVNGIQLPDVEGAIVSGTATGDWTLSCVRGDVQSITFVFSDGTVRTVPSPAKWTDGSDSKNRSGGRIGGLSEEHG